MPNLCNGFFTQPAAIKDATGRIALDPLRCKVTLTQSIRGGLQMTAVAEIRR